MTTMGRSNSSTHRSDVSFKSHSVLASRISTSVPQPASAAAPPPPPPRLRRQRRRLAQTAGDLGDDVCPVRRIRLRRRRRRLVSADRPSRQLNKMASVFMLRHFFCAAPKSGGCRALGGKIFKGWQDAISSRQGIAEGDLERSAPS